MNLYKIYNALTGEQLYEVFEGELTFEEPYMLVTDRGEITQSEYETFVKFNVVY